MGGDDRFDVAFYAKHDLILRLRGVSRGSKFAKNCDRKLFDHHARLSKTETFTKTRETWTAITNKNRWKQRRRRRKEKHKKKPSIAQKTNLYRN